MKLPPSDDISCKYHTRLLQPLVRKIPDICTLYYVTKDPPSGISVLPTQRVHHQ